MKTKTSDPFEKLFEHQNTHAFLTLPEAQKKDRLETLLIWLTFIIEVSLMIYVATVKSLLTPNQFALATAAVVATTIAILWIIKVRIGPSDKERALLRLHCEARMYYEKILAHQLAQLDAEEFIEQQGLEPWLMALAKRMVAVIRNDAGFLETGSSVSEKRLLRLISELIARLGLAGTDSITGDEQERVNKRRANKFYADLYPIEAKAAKSQPAAA